MIEIEKEINEMETLKIYLFCKKKPALDTFLCRPTFQEKKAFSIFVGKRQEMKFSKNDLP